MFLLKIIQSKIIIHWYMRMMLPLPCKNKFWLKQIHQTKKDMVWVIKIDKIVNEKCWINKKKEARLFCMRHFITSQIIHQIINCRKQHLPLQDWIFEICFWSTTQERYIFKRTVSCFIMIIYVVLPYKNIHVLVSMMHTTNTTNQD